MLVLIILMQTLKLIYRNTQQEKGPDPTSSCSDACCISSENAH